MLQKPYRHDAQFERDLRAATTLGELLDIVVRSGIPYSLSEDHLALVEMETGVSPLEQVRRYFLHWYVKARPDANDVGIGVRRPIFNPRSGGGAAVAVPEA